MILKLKDAEAARDSITMEQKKEISKLYNEWADEIDERAKFYRNKSTPSSVVSERYMKELKKQITETSHQVSNEVYSNIKSSMYLISDSVISDNVNWLRSIGFISDDGNAAFSYVPNEVVGRLITGQVYESGWSLSKAIWSDNEKTLKDIYHIMAKGTAEQKSIYDIAKELEKYVRPESRLPWNLTAKNGARIYKKQIDYNAQRLARTLSQHTYQQTLVSTSLKNPFIKGFIWVSNGSRVCDLCLDRDGQFYEKDQLPLDHPNGMCTMDPVISDDLTDQIADWINEPDGTYPEIDEFAKYFGYEAQKVQTTQDFINKYGFSEKSPSAWYNSLSDAQKAEAKVLKEQSGLTWNDWYEKNIHSTGDETQDFVKKYGSSTKSPNAWYNSLTPEQKAEAKALKEKSGLTWNDWYNKNIYSGSQENKVETAKAFSSLQDKYLSPYGFTPNNMPTNFDDWSHKISYEQASEILKSMGTNWQDPHPYQKLMQYYNENLANNSNFVNQVVTKTETTTATKVSTKVSKTKAKFSVDEWKQRLSDNDLRKMDGWTDEWLKNVSSKEQNAVELYTSNAYGEINRYLRGQDSSTQYKDTIKYCKEALSKASLPEETIVKRGSSYNMLESIGFSDIRPEDKSKVVGGIVKDKGFLSTSPDSHGGFTRDIDYIIKVPEGSQAMYIDSISDFQGEHELLINCGGRYKIEDVELKELPNGYYSVEKIYMTLINLK